MASRFEGSYRKVAERSKRTNGSKMPRGIARMNRLEKRDEATRRNLETLPYRTRRHRRWCKETTHDSYCYQTEGA